VNQKSQPLMTASRRSNRSWVALQMFQLQRVQLRFSFVTTLLYRFN